MPARAAPGAASRRSDYGVVRGTPRGATCLGPAATEGDPPGRPGEPQWPGNPGLPRSLDRSSAACRPLKDEEGRLEGILGLVRVAEDAPAVRLQTVRPACPAGLPPSPRRPPSAVARRPREESLQELAVAQDGDRPLAAEAVVPSERLAVAHLLTTWHRSASPSRWLVPRLRGTSATAAAGSTFFRPRPGARCRPVLQAGERAPGWHGTAIQEVNPSPEEMVDRHRPKARGPP